ncbi:MAG: hypothetical protein ACLR3C_10325 [Eggerthella lenta]
MSKDEIEQAGEHHHGQPEQRQVTAREVGSRLLALPRLRRAQYSTNLLSAADEFASVQIIGTAARWPWCWLRVRTPEGRFPEAEQAPRPSRLTT